MHFLEISRLVPNLEHALSGKVRQVNLTGSTILVPEPDTVAIARFYFSWLNHCLPRFPDQILAF